jgi:hypothetical protein
VTGLVIVACFLTSVSTSFLIQIIFYNTSFIVIIYKNKEVSLFLLNFLGYLYLEIVSGSHSPNTLGALALHFLNYELILQRDGGEMRGILPKDERFIIS